MSKNSLETLFKIPTVKKLGWFFLLFSFSILYGCITYLLLQEEKKQISHNLSTNYHVITQIDFATANSSTISWLSADSLQWIKQTLPHNWHNTTPNYKGLVWYSSKIWRTSEQLKSQAIFSPYINHDAHIFVNGEKVSSTNSFWQTQVTGSNTPYLIPIQSNLLKEGENELRFAVYSESPIRPGMGAFYIGEYKNLYPIFQSAWLTQQLMPFFSFVCFFSICLGLAILWFFHRNANYLLWLSLLAFSLTTIISQQTPNLTFFLANLFNPKFLKSLFEFGTVSSGIFLFLANSNFFNKKFELLEKIIFLGLIIVAVFIFVIAPNVTYERLLIECIFVSIIFSLSTIFSIKWSMEPHRMLAQKILIFPQLFAPFSSIHEMEVNFGFLPTHQPFISSLTCLSLIFGVILTLWYFTNWTLKTNFNNKILNQELKIFMTELQQTKVQEHELKKIETRNQERLRLWQDVHNSFTGNIAVSVDLLTKDHIKQTQVIDLLKSMRDDLRTVMHIGGSSESLNLETTLANVRHQMVDRLYAHNIELIWQITGNNEIDSSIALHLPMIVREALTNVIKHSTATKVICDFKINEAQIVALISDNGENLSSDLNNIENYGFGLRNIRMRINKLNGEFQYTEDKYGVNLMICIPLKASLKSDSVNKLPKS